MELKRRFDVRKIVTILYIVAFLTYLLVGLAPADAATYEISGGLAIPDINLISPVTTLELKNHKLNTPDTIVGSFSNNANKTLLIGHSTTVFKDLKSLSLDDSIYYDSQEYVVADVKVLEKSEIDMSELLQQEDIPTLVLMTCAGEPIGEKDASHRLIITAVFK